MNRFRPELTALVLLCLAAAGPATAETLKLGGTGAALGMLRALGEEFARAVPDMSAKVLPSLGSGGGIKAVHAGFLHVAATSRPLKAKEKTLNVRLIPFLRSPIVLASSHPRPDGLTVADIPRLFRDPAVRWHDGVPVTIIMRPVGETSFAFLESHVPGLKDAFAAARKRPELSMAATDQDSAAMAERAHGSLVILTFSHMVAEKPNLRVIAINGVRPTVADPATDRYPFVNTIHLVVRPDVSAATQRFMAFLATPAARRIIARNGASPLSLPQLKSETAAPVRGR